MKRNRYLLVLALVVVAVLGSACASLQRGIKTLQSDLGGGLDRTAYVYSADGTLLREYSGRFDVQETEYGNKVLFDVDGKRVIIYNATVIIEEQ